MEKSLTVRVEERIRHKRYGKFTRKFTTFRVHDETNQALEGDLVEIMETRPLSKTKRWRLVKILKKAVGSES
jgi:small subunit ribosomal protein S17